MDGPTMGNNRGKTVKAHKEIADFKTCSDLCSENAKCQSFLFHSKDKVCTLKDLLLIGTEPIVKKNKVYYSVYKVCEGIMFIFPKIHFLTNYINMKLLRNLIFQYH